MPITPCFDPVTGASGGASGGSPGPAPGGGPEWLEMATKYAAYDTQPGGAGTTIVWNEPTNGTGPYKYSVAVVENSQSSVWYEWDSTTRTITYKGTLPLQANWASYPIVWRIKAVDSEGNWGIGFVVAVYPSLPAGVANVTFQDDIVLDANQATTSFSFTVPPGLQGHNSSAQYPSMAYGNGLITPNINEMVSGARFQGPFTVKIAEGDIIVMETGQRETGVNNFFKRYQCVRRKAALDNQNWAPFIDVFDVDLKVRGGADPSSFTLPLTNSQQTHTVQWDPTGLGDLDEIKMNNVRQYITGTPADTEVAEIGANGAVLAVTTSASNSRGLRSRLQYEVRTEYTGTSLSPSRYVPYRYDTCGVWRYKGKFNVIGNKSWIAWGNRDNFGSGGNTIRFAHDTSGTPTGVGVEDTIRVECMYGNTYQRMGWIPQAGWNDTLIGVDLFQSGGKVRMVLYKWTGSDWPDLEGATNPYADYEHIEFVFMNESNMSPSGDQVSVRNGYSGVPDNDQSQLQYAWFTQHVFLGGNGAATASNTLERVAFAARRLTGVFDG